MKSAVNFMRGSVHVMVECPYPERFVNVCAQNGIEFWRLTRVSEVAVTVYMHIGGYKRLRALAARAGFTVKPVKKQGVPFFLWRIRKRYVLLIGMALSLIAIRVLALFVWEIEVYGNETIPTRAILENLKELGVGVGTLGLGITSEAISNEMILRIPELSWIAINVSGSHADVLVRERIPKPEIVDINAPAMVFAEKSGIIVKMSVLEGAKRFGVGDTIEAGDVLVTGMLDSLASGGRTVHAMADVYARTWYELSAQMPLETVIKEYTGEEKKKVSLIIAGKKINLFLNSGISWARYDKITETRHATLPTGNTLPFAFVTERYTEYIPEQSRLSVSDAEKILRERLMGELEDKINGGEIVLTEFETDVSGGVVTMTLRAECIEEIAAERSFTDDELAQAGTKGDEPVNE